MRLVYWSIPWIAVIFSHGTFLEVINGAKVALNYLITFPTMAICWSTPVIYPLHLAPPPLQGASQARLACTPEGHRDSVTASPGNSQPTDIIPRWGSKTD